MKVFRTAQYIKSTVERDGLTEFDREMLDPTDWRNILDGLTGEQIEALGYVWDDEWMAEE